MLKSYKHIFEEISEELGFSPDVIEDVYKACWRFTKEKVRQTQVMEAQSWEDLAEMKTSFYFPNLGKFHASYDKIEKMRRKAEWMNKNLNK